MTIIGERAIRKATRRIDQQRRSGCYLHITEERKRYAAKCMQYFILPAERRLYGIRYEIDTIGGAA